MSRGRIIFSLMVFGALGISTKKITFAQESSASALPQSKAKPAPASLKICLRLLDDTPFLGFVNLRVTPEEGYEVLGAPADTPGDYLFPEVAPGKYMVEISAPGFLAARL